MQLATEEPLVQEFSSTLIAAGSQSGAVFRAPEELAHIVSLFASSDGWLERVWLRADHRCGILAAALGIPLAIYMIWHTLKLFRLAGVFICTAFSQAACGRR